MIAKHNALNKAAESMERPEFLAKIHLYFRVHPIVALLGPRQSGKTTLAKQFCKEVPHFNPANYFDLENYIDLQRLENPINAFAPLSGLIVIDEIQRRPDLFPVLRYISDENPQKQFLILGSASKDLLQQSSESLAGRIGYIEVTPFAAHEVPDSLKKLWHVGGFPRSFLKERPADSFLWLESYIRTYLEQDLPNLGVRVPSPTMQRFWLMLSHYHGQVFNASEMAHSLALSAPTTRHYLDILNATFMVRVLKPWHENLKKRQVKQPKIYIRDSGIFHSLQRLLTEEALLTSPKLGSSWEGFALEAVLSALQVRLEDAYFWATHNKAELDLLVTEGSKKQGFEFKYQDAPKMTPSMRIALEDLELEHLTVIYPGNIDYSLTDRITVKSLKGFCEEKNRDLDKKSQK